MNLLWLITPLVLIIFALLAYGIKKNQQFKQEQRHLLQMYQNLEQQLMHFQHTLTQREREVQQHLQQKKALEHSYQAQNNCFEQILAALPQAVFWKDQQGVYLGCNHTFAHQLGLSTPAEVIGKTDETLPGLGAQASFYQRCEQAVMEKGQTLANTEAINELAHGRNTILLAQRYPLRDNTGEIIGILGLCTDISVQKQLEQQKSTQLAHLIEIDEVINKTVNFEQQISELLQTLVSLVDADRAWLLYPCDPEASVAHFIFKNTQGPFASSLTTQLEITPTVAAEFKKLFNESLWAYETPTALPLALKNVLAMQASLMCVIYPHQDKPWLFSLDHCRQSHQWLEEEQQLFQIIAQRLTQILNNRQLMSQLKATEAQQQFLLEHTPDLICFKDAQNRWQVANKTYLTLLQLGEHDYRGQTDAELQAHTPVCEVLQLSEQYDQQTWAQKVPLRTEEHFPRVDGSVKIFEAIRLPLFTPEGAPQALVISGRDITEQHRTHAALEASQRRLANIVDIADDAIISINHAQEIILFNQGAEKIFGYKTEAILGRPLSLLLPEDVIEQHYQQVISFAQSVESSRKMAERQIIRGRRQDGSLFAAEASIAQFKSDDTSIFTVILRDITLRQWAEHSLQQSEVRYRSLFEQAPISQWELDYSAVKAYLDELQLTTQTALQQYADTHPEFIQQCFAAVKIIDMNQMTLTLFEAQTQKQLLDQLPQLLSSEAETIFQKQLLRLLDGQTTLETATCYYTLSGRRLDVIIKFNLLAGYEANWQHILLSIIDQTETQLTEAPSQLQQHVESQTSELQNKIYELSRLVRSRDEFLACTSHDLRAPLNSILNTTEVLQEQIFGSLTEKQFRYLENIKNSGRHLLNLINDILDVSKIEADKLTLEFDTVLVQEVCQSSLVIIKEMVYKKRLKLTSNFDNSVNAVRADQRRLKQILVNLLSNAVKFTPQGGSIGLEVQGDREHREVHFIIWDTGIGIPQQDKQSLFEPFHRLKSHLMSQPEGTGLGLVLVRRLTEMHGGHISFISEVEQGSRFTVSLPWHPEDNITATQALAESSVDIQDTAPANAAESGALILLADDNEGQLNTVKDFLQFKGYRIVTAKDGIAAIENAKKIQPELILMAIQMPDMNGLDAISYIRADPNLATIPIVAVTALAIKGDRERCLAAGANEYLSKPFNFKELLKTIMAQLA